MRYQKEEIAAVIADHGRALVNRFIDECITKTEERGQSSSLKELYNAFLAWCHDKELPAISSLSFSTVFAQVIPRLSDRSRGTRYRCRNDFGVVDTGNTTNPIEYAAALGVLVVDNPSWSGVGSAEWWELQHHRRVIDEGDLLIHINKAPSPSIERFRVPGALADEAAIRRAFEAGGFTITTGRAESPVKKAKT